MLLAALGALADVCDVYYDDGDMEAAVPDSRIHRRSGGHGGVEVDWQGHGDRPRRACGVVIAW